MDEFNRAEQQRSLGELLRDIRESKRLSREAVSLRLKIDRRQLEALERNEYGTFPAHVYARGVFERYANFLHLDQTEALRLFEEAWLKQHPATRFPLPASETLWTAAWRRLISRMRVNGAALSALTIVLFAASGYLFFYQTPSFSFEAPADRSIMRDYRVSVEGRADSRLELTLNKKPVYIGESGVFQHTILLQKGINELVLEGKTKFGRISTLTRYVVVK